MFIFQLLFILMNENLFKRICFGEKIVKLSWLESDVFIISYEMTITDIRYMNTGSPQEMNVTEPYGHMSQQLLADTCHLTALPIPAFPNEMLNEHVGH